ncbi:amino acid permease [Streptomyces sp. NPDC014676]|uniref:amino acid permease n=1 Tax=Streptomyces sp. NPDC014676 TaxID=3364879 RepID=UPI0036FE6D7E
MADVRGDEPVVIADADGATDSYLDAVTGWQARRFGWEVPREWVMQTAGIITTLKTAVQAFSAPGDSVLIQPPVYAHFHDDIRLNGAIYFVMRALGEMSVAEPVSGAYISYANRSIHRFAGFLNGWNAFIFLLATTAAELNALGRYVQYWFPSAPIWATAAVAVTVMFVVNVVGVKFYGEAEFWFAIIKVAAIIALILFGFAMVVFGVGNRGHAIGLGHLHEHGGFFPNGVSGAFLAIVMVAFSFGGVENLGIAAGETKDVATPMPKAVNATFWRLMIFYVGAITVLVTVFLWTSLNGSGSPFVAVFAKIGVPAAATVMAAIMTMTPVSMSEHGHGLTVVGVTISGHLLGMYAFSPVVGRLSDRIGHMPTIVAGQAVFLVSAVLSGIGHDSVGMMMTGLFFLGLGWSLSLVAGSAMLSETTPAALRPGVQGTTETAMNVVAAVGAGLAGPLMGWTGFGVLNAVAAVLVLPVLAFRAVLVRAR